MLFICYSKCKYSSYGYAILPHVSPTQLDLWSQVSQLMWTLQLAIVSHSTVELRGPHSQISPGGKTISSWLPIHG